MKPNLIAVYDELLGDETARRLQELWVQLMPRDVTLGVMDGCQGVYVVPGYERVKLLDGEGLAAFLGMLAERRLAEAER